VFGSTLSAPQEMVSSLDRALTAGTAASFFFTGSWFFTRAFLMAALGFYCNIGEIVSIGSA